MKPSSSRHSKSHFLALATENSEHEMLSLGPGEFERLCCFSVTKSCLTLCEPRDCSTPGFPVLHLPDLRKLMLTELVMPSNHLILCRPLLLLPSTFPSIRVFSSELTLHIRWPEYWSSASASSFHSSIVIQNHTPWL